MKVLIATGIYPPDVGGPATYSKALFEELPKYNIGGKKIEVQILSFGTVRHLPPIVRHIMYFLKVLRLGGSADIIFAQDPVSVGLPAMLVAKILKKKFLLKVVGDYAWEQGAQRFGVKEVLDEFLDRKYGWRVEFLRKIEKSVANGADKIIVPSEYLKKVVMKWGIGPEKIKVIYNAFELFGSKEITPPPPLILMGETREKLSLSQNDKIIVSAGRLVPWKGFDVLIEIMPEILKIIPDAKLIIIGDGPERGNLENIARGVVGPKAQVLQDLAQTNGASRAIPQSRLQSNRGSATKSGQANMRVLAKFGAEAENNAPSIIFTGNLPREKVLEYLAATDIFVLNTSYEGLSHQILEAMAVGCPVVTTDAGGNPELITDSESGLLVKFNDKNGLKSKILEVLSNTALAQKLAQNASKKASEFSKERMLKETVNLLENI